MKRRNGEGTIFKDKNGRWVAMAYVPRVDGSSKREYVASGKKYEVVKKKLDERLSQKSRFTPPSEKNWSVGEYLDYWLREIHAREIRHTTKTTYEVMIRKHIKPFLGNYKLRELSVFNLRCSLDAMEEQGRTARIRLECLRVLSVCLNYAMSEEGGELVSRNVAQLVKKPKYKNKEIVIWTAEQAAWFLRVAQTHPKYIAFLLILIYGIRRGEAIGLSWTDIDFEDNKVHIRQQLCRIDGKVVACDLKTDSSRRVLPLLPFVREALLAYAAKNGITIPPFNPHHELSTQNIIVTSEAGTPIDPDNVLRSFESLTKKVGLPRITVHAMRHTAATLLKDLGVPVKDAQIILGHADIITTARIYQHGTEKTQRAAIVAMENCLTGRPVALQTA